MDFLQLTLVIIAGVVVILLMISILLPYFKKDRIKELEERVSKLEAKVFKNGTDVKKRKDGV